MVNNEYIAQIEQLLQNNLPQVDKDGLDKLTQNYPCFHGAHLLKAIHLKQSDEKGFEDELPLLASYVNNRVVLYDRVHAVYAGETVKLEHVVNPAQEPIKEAEKKEESKVAAAQLEQEPKKENSKEKVLDKTESEDLKSLVDSIRASRKKESVNKLERRAKNIEGEVNKNRKKTSQASKEASEKVKRDSKKSKKLEAPKEKVLDEDKPKSFTDWLKKKKSLEDKSAPLQDKIEEKEKNVKEEIPIDMAVSNEAELLLEAKKSSYKLEDFLVSQIQKKQDKKEDKRKGIHAISETYAKILASQGKTEEAISIYKELSIKYPKKSSNFARQIEKLKEQ